ncbi:MAG: RluA family pseudouridine synthase [Candidatus Saganbacteria bacterium]|nr:RluA family pseudouridine synthase [Candidatus Saganbacteria bacterium]
MQEAFEFIIPHGDTSEERLDSFLARQTKAGLSRSQVKKLISDGYVEVNKEACKASYQIKPDDRIMLKLPPPKGLEVKPENIPLDIVYQDEAIVVVNKPRGMVVHPAAGNYSGTLVNALLYHLKDLSGIGGILRPGIVHRLDKDTSGLLVAAKTDQAHQSLTRQFKEKQVLKQYLALVHGEVKDNEGLIESRIGRHPVHRKKMAVIEGSETLKSREAVTHYRVRERFKQYTLLEITLKTGRTHQIRVHLTSIGHPLVGDLTYGHRKEEFRVKGQLLHAAKLGFVHPLTGEHVRFTADLPPDMAEVLRKLQERQAGRRPRAD